MREIRLSGSEGGGPARKAGLPTPIVLASTLQVSTGLTTVPSGHLPASRFRNVEEKSRRCEAAPTSDRSFGSQGTVRERLP